MTTLHLYAGHGPLADAGLRAAVVAAIDQQKVARLLGGTTADGPFPGVLQIGATHGAMPKYKQAAARALLRGRTPTLTLARRTFSGPAADGAVSLVAQQLAAVGFVVKTVAVAKPSEYYDGIRNGKFDLSIDAQFASDTDAADWLPVYVKNGVFSGVVPTADRDKIFRAMTAAQATVDRPRRQMQAPVVMDDLLADGAVLPLYAYGSVALVGSRVQGFELAPFSRIDLADLRVG